MGLPETRRLNDHLLLRAAREWRRRGPRQTGNTPDPVATATIRDWCTRSGRLADVFDAAYEDGRRRKAAKKTDRKRLLPD